MRGLAPVLALLLVPALSGCAGDELFETEVKDCSVSQAYLESASEVVLPAQTPEEAKVGPTPVVRVEARPGQQVTALAVYEATLGDVSVRFDGPGPATLQQAGSTYVWQSSGIALGGEYRLELVGDPLASFVGYNLYLSATGCTVEE